MTLSPDSIDYLKAFLGGVGISFTPCVYPLIPVTAGYVAANASGSKIKGFILSLIYVTGMAVTYSILGLIASLTGSIFGRISSHPVTHIVVGIVIILFGLSMFELFIIPLPRIIKAPRSRKESYFSVFLLGLSSGLVASPCLTPLLGSILVLLATKQNLIYGTILLLSFAYGMGLILILVGTFSALLINLPKSGRWMGYVKKAGSIILLAMGSYFIYIGIRRIGQ